MSRMTATTMPSNGGAERSEFDELVARPAAPRVEVSEDGRLKPRNMEGIQQIAAMIVRSGMAPRGLETPEKCAVAIALGLSVGLDPMQSIQSIAVINGRPSIYGDAMLAVCHASGLVEDYREELVGKGEEYGFKVTVKRKGVPTPFTGSFTVADARRAGLWGKQGPWSQYPKRMVQFRARGFVLRDAFADRLRGMVSAEEAEDMPTSTPSPLPPVLLQPSGPTRADKDAFLDSLPAAAPTPAAHAPVAQAVPSGVDPETGEVIDTEETQETGNPVGESQVDPKEAYEQWRIATEDLHASMNGTQEEWKGTYSRWVLKHKRKGSEWTASMDERKMFADAIRGRSGVFAYLVGR